MDWNAGSGLVNWSVCGDILARELNDSIWRESISGNKLKGPEVEMSSGFSKDSSWYDEKRGREGATGGAERPDHGGPCM